MKVYKLTDGDGRTMGGTQWAEGVTHSGTGEGSLCGPGWIHAYSDPVLAVMLNPIHAGFSNPTLWEAEGHGDMLNNAGLKCGFISLTTIRCMDLPEVPVHARVRFSIMCAMQRPQSAAFMQWAENWLSGSDRSAEAVARAAAEVAWDREGAATRAAARAALAATRGRLGSAARAAARAAEVVAETAAWEAETAGKSAAWAAWAAEASAAWAAWGAGTSAAWAAWAVMSRAAVVVSLGARGPLDLAALAHRAVAEEQS